MEKGPVLVKIDKFIFWDDDGLPFCLKNKTLNFPDSMGETPLPKVFQNQNFS